MGKDDGTVPKSSVIARSLALVFSKRRPVWVMVAVFLVVGGIISSVLAAVSLGNL